jgi:hypothetical protein
MIARRHMAVCGHRTALFDWKIQILENGPVVGGAPKMYPQTSFSAMPTIHSGIIAPPGQKTGEYDKDEEM